MHANKCWNTRSQKPGGPGSCFLWKAAVLTLTKFGTLVTKGVNYSLKYISGLRLPKWLYSEPLKN